MVGKKSQQASAPAKLKVLPHNLEAEKVVLGGILLNNDALNQVVELLAAEDFYHESHGALFEGMVALYDEGEPIDVITLAQMLKRKKLFDKVGGTQFLADLGDAVATSAGIYHHARIIKGLAVRRKLISHCSGISEACFQDWEDVGGLLDMAEQSLYDIAEDQVKEGFQELKDVVKDSFKRLEAVSVQPGHVTGVPTGFTDLDRLTAGMQPSDLIILAGRPSMGKTALALNIAHNAARETGKGVAVFSLEMSRAQLGIRLMGFDAGIDASKMRTGYLNDDEWRKLTESASRLSEMPIFIDDSSALGVLEMKAKCRRLRKHQELGLIIIDYLQLVQGRRAAESRQTEISEISRALKALAKDLNVPVMALSQLNRKVEDRPNKRPQMADLRESGAIEQDADVIAFIYRDEVYKPDVEDNRNMAEIIVAKQRNGPTGFLKLTFRKELTRFENFSDDERPLP